MTPPVMTSWLPTVKEMLALKVPIIFTCYSQIESDGVKSILCDHFWAKQISSPGSLNPFRCELDEYKTKVFQETSARSSIGETDACVNHFYWVVCGSRYSDDQLELVLPYVLNQVHHFGVIVAARDLQQWFDMLKAPSMETRLTGCHILAQQLAHPLIAGLAGSQLGKKGICRLRREVASHPTEPCIYGSMTNVLKAIDDSIIPLVSRGALNLAQWGSLARYPCEFIVYDGKFLVFNAPAGLSVYEEPNLESAVLQSIHQDSLVQGVGTHGLWVELQAGGWVLLYDGELKLAPQSWEMVPYSRLVHRTRNLSSHR